MKIIRVLPLVLLLCFANAELTHGSHGATDIPSASLQETGPGGEFLIRTAKQLAELPISAGMHYVLMNDIDLPPNWVPIGSGAHPFEGKFDGGGHTIRGLSIAGRPTEPQGLFGTIQDAEIYNLVLENAKITLTGDATAGLLVGAVTDSLINNITIIGGAITSGGESIVGGLAGRIAGETYILDCETDTDITGSIAGGIVGQAIGANLSTNANHKMEILRCKATGSVTATAPSKGQHPAMVSGVAGGFIGQGAFVLIEDSASYGTVTGQNVGGFVGELANFSRVLYSYAQGDVFSCGLGGSVGGFVGVIKSGSCIEFSYSGGAVAAHSQSHQEWDIGGFAGTILANDAPTTITHSFSFSPWVVGPADSNVQRFVGSSPHGGVNGCYAALSSMVVKDSALMHVLPSAFGADGGDVSNTQVEVLARRLGWRRGVIPIHD